ncbi:TetR family transcriptional regulator [Yinghuangia sp. YIM S09857]|uniref:TetR family transcriptional regulator n=1 Tax=Yinghuangia sp. YIM S09857 TaxID=3436929 RepID=UPI003F536D38
MTRAAVELVDSEGGAALTTTNLARRLGVSQPALYAHVANPAAARRAVGLYGMRQMSEAPQSSVIGHRSSVIGKRSGPVSRSRPLSRKDPPCRPSSRRCSTVSSEPWRSLSTPPASRSTARRPRREPAWLTWLSTS